MNLRLSCADYAFPFLSHDQALDRIAALHLDGVDIGLFARRTHLQHNDILLDNRLAARDLVSRVEGRGLTIADVFHQSGPDLVELAENHPDKAQRTQARDLFLRMLEFAKLCGAPHITTLPGITWPDESNGESLQRASDELAWRAEAAAHHGMVYAIEPHMESVAPTPELAERLIKMTPGLTLTLDYGHYIATGFSEFAIERLWPHTSHFHARSAAQNKLQCSLEENTIHWGNVIHAASGAGYRGFLALEYVVVDDPYVLKVDTVEETRRLRDVLQDAQLRNDYSFSLRGQRETHHAVQPPSTRMF